MEMESSVTGAWSLEEGAHLGGGTFRRGDVVQGTEGCSSVGTWKRSSVKAGWRLEGCKFLLAEAAFQKSSVGQPWGAS